MICPKPTFKARLVVLPFIFLFCCLILSKNTIAVAQTADPGQKSVSVSALVPPVASDFQFNLRYEGSSVVHQDQRITYEITYGASSSAGMTTNNSIVVHYSSDLGPDKAYIVDYEFGSATKGYGGTEPIINTKERTITWILPPLPEGTMDQKVKFELRAHGNQYDLQRVTFRTRAAMSNEYVSLPDYGVQQDYLFDPLLVTHGPTATPGITIPPTPTPTPLAIQFNDISVTNLSQTNATISVKTNKPTVATFRYGTNPTALTTALQLTRFTRSHEIELKNLTPNTKYYYRIFVRDTDAKIRVSDIFTFTTAEPSEALVKGKDAFILTSGDTVLLSTILEANKENNGYVLLPTNTGFKLTYTFASSPDLASLEAWITNDQGTLQRVQMTAVDSRTYTANLRTRTEGAYNLLLVQSDDKGNIMSRRISNIRVSLPIRVLESQTSLPIPDARFFLSKFNSATGKFVAIDNILISNPQFTNTQGELPLILTPGKYQAQISAFGFRDQTLEFNIGYPDNAGYPTILLERDALNLISLFTFLKNTFIDTFQIALGALKQLTTSVRVFTTVATVTLGSSVLLGFLLFIMRTNIRWKEILPFFIFNIALARRTHHEEFIYGSIRDAKGQPIQNVRLEFVHIKTNVVLAHTVTNKQGGFRIENEFEVPYVKLVAAKENLAEVTMIVPTDIAKAVVIRMDAKAHSIKEETEAGLRRLLGGLFEIILIVSLLLELAFLDAFGVQKALPFIVLTFFNLACWIFYQREHNLHKV